MWAVDRFGDEAAVVAARVSMDGCLDLLNPYWQRELADADDQYMAECLAEDRPPARGSHGPVRWCRHAAASRTSRHTDALAFRLGMPGCDWQAIYSEPGVKAVVGATDRALDTDHAEHTLQVIGAMGGLLADLGFQVCPASALTAGTIRPSVLAWVAAGDAPGDDLLALEAPCIVIGPCPAAPADWACIDASEFDKRNQFIRSFVAEVSSRRPPRRRKRVKQLVKRTTADGHGRRRTSTCEKPR